MNAWGAAELSSARTVAGGHGEAARIKRRGRERSERGLAEVGQVPELPKEGVAGRVAGAEGEANPPRVPIYMNAWGAAELSSARTIAGGHGNPPRVPI